MLSSVNTKVDMRFNVIDAEWLSERIRLKLLDTVSAHIDALQDTTGCDCVPHSYMVQRVCDFENLW